MSNNQNNQGLTIIEIMFVVFIVTSSLVAVLGLVAYSLQPVSQSQMKLIASGLAQEGIEVIHSIRRSYKDWDEWYSAISTTTDCYIQYNSQCLTCCPDICCPDVPKPCPTTNTPLRLDSNTGLYQYQLGDFSPFSRKITLTKIGDNQVNVKVEVKWQERGKEHNFIVEGELWNWMEIKKPD
ncbi:MAG: hypothetical protein QME57_02365 [Patescibacteria group bacterium]|nr:hypothetical protein [Patescibacteria group bacterium]